MKSVFVGCLNLDNMQGNSVKADNDAALFIKDKNPDAIDFIGDMGYPDGGHAGGVAGNIFFNVQPAAPAWPQAATKVSPNLTASYWVQVAEDLYGHGDWDQICLDATIQQRYVRGDHDVGYNDWTHSLHYLDYVENRLNLASMEDVFEVWALAQDGYDQILAGGVTAAPYISNPTNYDAVDDVGWVPSWPRGGEVGDENNHFLNPANVQTAADAGLYKNRFWREGWLYDGTFLGSPNEGANGTTYTGYTQKPDIEKFYLDSTSSKDRCRDNTAIFSGGDSRDILPSIADRAMYGPVQEAWFVARINSSQADFKQVIQEPTTFGNSSYLGDSNSGSNLDGQQFYSGERDRILKTIDDSGITGVIWTSSNRHVPHMVNWQVGANPNVSRGHCCFGFAPTGNTVHSGAVQRPVEGEQGVEWVHLGSGYDIDLDDSHNVYGLIEYTDGQALISFQSANDDSVLAQWSVASDSNFAVREDTTMNTKVFSFVAGDPAQIDLNDLNDMDSGYDPAFLTGDEFFHRTQLSRFRFRNNTDRWQLYICNGASDNPDLVSGIAPIDAVTGMTITSDLGRNDVVTTGAPTDTIGVEGFEYYEIVGGDSATAWLYQMADEDTPTPGEVLTVTIHLEDSPTLSAPLPNLEVAQGGAILLDVGALIVNPSGSVVTYTVAGGEDNWTISTAGIVLATAVSEDKSYLVEVTATNFGGTSTFYTTVKVGEGSSIETGEVGSLVNALR